ncbi:MAG: Ig-like domain-containing protein [Rhodospirillales bacterium]
MPEKPSSRLVMVAGIGLAAVVAAIGLNFILNPDDDQPPPQSSASEQGARLEPGTRVGDGATGPRPPAFDVVRVNPDGDAVIAGRAAPGSTVVILDGDQELGRVEADQRGEWVFVPDGQLKPGNRELTLRQEDATGAPLSSESAVVLVVPDRNGERPIALQIERSGQGPSRLVQGPVERDASVQVAIDVVDYGPGGELHVSGHAPADSTVRLYLDNKLLGETTANEGGDWRLTPGDAIGPGLYTLRADQINQKGEVLARAEIPFKRAEELPALGDNDRIIVQPGNSLWRLARRTYGDGFAFTTIFEANRSQIRDPDLIYPGQIFEIPRGR